MKFICMFGKKYGRFMIHYIFSSFKTCFTVNGELRYVPNF